MTLNTADLINCLIENGYTHLCVVPCSFAKNIINEAINNRNIEYLPAASEAVACSIAAGLKMSNKKPIVIVQSSGLTNMGSCITSLLKPYNITFPIITSWRTYELGDCEIQHQHLANNLPKLIHSYGYKFNVLDNLNLSNAINQINECNLKHIMCIIKADSFDKVNIKRNNKIDLSLYLQRSKFLVSLNNIYKNKNVLFIGTTGNTSREMYKLMPDTKNFYMVGNMGGALSVGVGAALTGKKVIICGGDAEFAMHMGGLTTAGRYAKTINLTYIVFDNEQNKSTGGQSTYQKHLNYTQIAKSAGFYTNNHIIRTLDDFELNLREVNGLKFVTVKCNVDEEMPRPPLKKVKINKLSKISRIYK